EVRVEPVEALHNQLEKLLEHRGRVSRRRAPAPAGQPRLRRKPPLGEEHLQLFTGQELTSHPLPPPFSRPPGPEAPHRARRHQAGRPGARRPPRGFPEDRKSTRLNSSHVKISYAVFCLKKKKK